MSKEAIEYYRTLADLLESQQEAAEHLKKLEMINEDPETAFGEDVDITYRDYGITTFRAHQSQKKLDDMQKRGVIPGTITAGTISAQKINAGKMVDGNLRASMGKTIAEGVKRGLTDSGIMADDYKPGDMPHASYQSWAEKKYKGYATDFAVVSDRDLNAPAMLKGAVYEVYENYNDELHTGGYYFVDMQDNKFEIDVPNLPKGVMFAAKEAIKRIGRNMVKDESSQATDVAGVRPIGAMIDEYQPGDVPKVVEPKIVEEMDVGKSLGHKRSGYSAVANGDWSVPPIKKGVIYPIYLTKDRNSFFFIDEEGNHYETNHLRDTKYYWLYNDSEVEIQAQRFADDQEGGEAID